MSYLSVAAIESALQNLATAYPGLTSLVTLPHPSIEGVTSHALRISNGGFGLRDAVMMIGGQHAREWGSSDILVNFATAMLSAFTSNSGLQYGGKSFSAATIQSAVGAVEIVVFPQVNPDGRGFSLINDVNNLNGWRKNRNPASSGGVAANIGVDLNRNYDFLWNFPLHMAPNAPGASASPADETFHGTAPFSEPETKNVEWLLDAVPRTRWFLDIHSYSQLILYNWGDDQNQSVDASKNFRNPAWDGKRGISSDTYSEYIHADDEQVARSLAVRMKSTIAAVRGKNYTAEPSFSLYPTSGAVDDYVYARHIVNPARSHTYGFTIEWGSQFHPPWAEMELIVDDITAALIDFTSAAPCGAGSIVVAPTTSQLSFVDVPAGTGTARAIVFSAQSCDALTLQVTAGPSRTAGVGTFGLPLGGVVTLPSAPNALTREARIWVSFTAGAAGSTAAGSITVHCPETGVQWTIPITANASAKPTVASVLVLDRSGSMDFASGLPGKKRIDVLHEAAPSFVELLGPNDGIGVVAFDQGASLSAAVAQAGPLGFGAGRAGALAAISAHQTNPSGSTSIGDGVELGHDTVTSTSGYDKKAVVVLTDGEENTAKYIADIASKIDDRVYAIGLGTASELNPIALSALVKNTGGYLMLTGPLTPSEQFRVTKYFMQILSGVVNNQIVVDPQGHVAPNVQVRVPFDLTEADTSADIVLLSPYRKYLSFRVESPTGDVIDPSTVTSLVDSVFVPGRSLDEYHLSLPAIWPSHSAQAGRWYALVEIVSQRDNPAISSTHRDTPAAEPGEAERRSVAAHGAPWLITVQAQSSLTMTSDAVARAAAPPTLIDHAVALRQLDIPLDTRCAVRVEATDPSGATQSVTLSATGVGTFGATTNAPSAGVYTFRYVAEGMSFAGIRFTREQVRTVAVWFGADDPPPRDDCAGHGSDCCCGTIECVLEDDGIRKLLARYDIDAGRLLKCIESRERG